jgi:acyl dehydratase
MEAPLETIAEIRAKVGQDLEQSPWLLIDQTMVNTFADVVFEADSWTHTDPVRSAPLGGTTVPGMLLLSMIPYLLRPHVGMPEGFTNGFNYGFDRLRFTNVLRVGKRVRAHARLLEFGPHGETGWRRKLKVTVEIEGEVKPAMVTDWMVLYV